jgi:DNA-binding transcriptional regulator GbsR (MarR family)
MENYSNKIIELRREKKTYKEITQILGCAMSTVSYHCQKHKLGDNKQKLTNEEKKEIQSLYDKVGSLKKVAKLTNRSFETVKKYVIIKEKEKKVTNSQSVILWRKRVKKKLIEYKGGKCEICGYNKCERALQFHHKNPMEKDFSISGRSLSFDRLKEEVDKCMLVCSNCHCEIHDELKLRE